MSLLPVAVWGLVVDARGSIVPAISDIPASFRVTMAALDPTAKPGDEKQPMRSTLKIMRRPLRNPDFDDDESEDSDSGEEQEAQPVMGMKGFKKSDSSTKKDNAVAEDKMDEDEDGESTDYDDSEIEEFTICTLDTERNYQQPLDIVIGEDEECYFKVVGNFDISLTGNYVVGPGDVDNYDGDSEGSGGYDLSPDEDELGLYGEDPESDDLDNLEDPRIQEVTTDEETEVNGAKKKTEKKTKNKNAEKKSLKRSTEDSDGEGLALDDLTAETKDIIDVAAAAPEKKLSKKHLKKLKANNGKAVDATAEAKAKKVQFAKELEQGPTLSPVADKTAGRGMPESAIKQPKVVQGVTIMDSKIGSGPAAKKGNKLAVRYIGKLENGKIFDKNTKGKPFTFSLGKGEVVKGWDIGLEGMQVGGERRLKVPPSSAYSKRTIPEIPANNTLIFDVKLIDIK